jgi:hypothetical protein
MSKAIAGDFDTVVCGIPCQVKVDSYVNIEPQGKWADSDWDCYGYIEIEFTLLDRKGYKANWLQKKMTPADIETLEIEIVENAA